MNRAAVVLVLAFAACSRGSPEGAFLSKTVPMEVKKQDGDKYSVTLSGDVLLMGTLTGHVITVSQKDKEVTVEFNDDWSKATVRDGVLARDFARVPPEELKARIAEVEKEQAEEKKRRQAEYEENKKRFNEAKGLLAKGKYAEAKTAFEALAEKAQDFEAKAVQEYVRVSGREVADQQRLEVAEAQLGRGELDAAEATLKQTDPETLQATRRGALLDKLQAAKSGKSTAAAPKKKK